MSFESRYEIRLNISLKRMKTRAIGTDAQADSLGICDIGQQRRPIF